MEFKNREEMIEFEEKRFTEKDIKKDDYIKTKQLVLKKDNQKRQIVAFFIWSRFYKNY